MNQKHLISFCIIFSIVLSSGCIGTNEDETKETIHIYDIEEFNNNKNSGLLPEDQEYALHGMVTNNELNPDGTQSRFVTLNETLILKYATYGTSDLPVLSFGTFAIINVTVSDMAHVPDVLEVNTWQLEP